MESTATQDGKHISPMIQNFDKYVAVLSKMPDGSLVPFAIYDEGLNLNGVNVCGTDGLVYYIPERLMNQDQALFYATNRDPDGRLGTLTIVGPYLFKYPYDLFPDPAEPAVHSSSYARAIESCRNPKGRRSVRQIAAFPFSDFLERLTQPLK